MKKLALRGAIATAATLPLMLGGTGVANAVEAEAFVLGPVAIITATDIPVDVLENTVLCTAASLVPPIPGVPLFDVTDLLNLPDTQRFLLTLTPAIELELESVDVIVTCVGLGVPEVTTVTIDLTSGGSIS